MFGSWMVLCDRWSNEISPDYGEQLPAIGGNSGSRRGPRERGREEGPLERVNLPNGIWPCVSCLTPAGTR